MANRLGRWWGVADRCPIFAVSERQRVGLSTGLVKKLLQQRRATGEIGPRHDRSGRKPLLGEAHRKHLRELLAKQPDLTLAQLRDALTIQCSLPAIHYVLAALGLTYKKRRSVRPSKAGRTSATRLGSREARRHRRRGSQDESDAPAGPRAPRPTLAGELSARPLAHHDDDLVPPHGRLHRLPDDRRGH